MILEILEENKLNSKVPYAILTNYCEKYPEYVDLYPLTLIVKSLDTNDDKIDMDLFIKMMNIISKYKNHEMCDNMNMDALSQVVEDIYKNKDDIKNIVERVFFYEKKYEYEFKSFPMLFIKILTDNDMDMQQLTHMLKIASNIRTNETSRYDASVKVGDSLYKKYVEPKMTNK